MPKMISKSLLKWLVFLAAIGAIAFFSYQYWKEQQSTLPKGIVSGNGRIEAKLVDAVAKDALRVKEILVDEGDLVKPGEVLVRLDTATFDAQLAEATLRVASAEERVASANFAVVKQKSLVENAQIEYDRDLKLVKENAIAQRELDTRTTQLATAKAALSEEEAKLATAKAEVEVAKASVATIQTHIDDATLKSPVLGRVLYRLAEPGEMLAAGGKALTLVNLEDVYMEIYLPSEEAAGLKVGTDARITVDFAPGRAAPGYVSFVSPEAQFTPKQVETKSERDKLMFRVKIQVPKELVSAHVDRVKTGIRGVGYVKIKDSAVWPSWLEKRFADPAEQPDKK
ncbi:MAG TPA: efflux RND transporter periplasmic adaptor subunit [Candidatus Omnitrophota bacterium]|nr:efflux RND transporter periplasmic adaptor subunit [Candidatus Omnitrophota bacterium]HRY85520.1 efflux RND transporter periplasmic adaptor subunit [Candidatus Omnitrophota bacterium]